MTLIILGLALWAGVHFWKRVAPDHRAAFGEKGKGIVAIGSVIAIVLMVIGYRMADGAGFWGRSSAMTGINNILMLFAFYLFAASGKGTRITRIIRHPQLTAMVVWSIAHLLVNGDTTSFVLFGGLGIWAVAEMVVINRAQGPRGAYHAPPIKSEVIAAVATLVVFSIVAGIHLWLGYNPFG
ncbi:NnrU family protein [Octadecabacter sp. 1_MG-2023]|uniref:NnrU family protein n=1 Tax=unclassified Octadecabacter TaxID=196158 RepID=UPI001C0927C3|nr:MULTISPECIES: NnrU family protein [unclassified Octadecabacter]MBU2991776.1 NnrU family protein [Octadecabacter sp. B2R22]MDO6735749.1 NnrU family protein [Octadecabacter sp. 1_MG-2023]